MIMPGMLDVVRQFHASESFVSASLTAFILGGASLQIFLGPLSDRFGRRPVMIAGAIFFLICTLFIAVSFSITSFMWGRFFQGMGLCFIAVIGYAALHELYDDVSAVRLIAIMSTVTLLAPLAGPLFGVLILHLFSSWRIIFVMIAFFSAIALVGLYFYMPETLNTYKKDGTYVPLTSLKISVIKDNYLALLKNKAFMFGTVSLGVGMIPIIAWIGVSPLILMQEGHLTLFAYALWQIPVFIACIVGSLSMRWLTRYMTLSRLAYVGSISMLLSGIIMIFLSILFKGHYIAIAIGISCYGFSGGLMNGPLTRLTLFSTPIPKGTASALISFALMFIMAIGNQVVGALYNTYHENLYFGLLCGMSGIVYIVFYYFFCESHHQSLK